jgi:hypothetical protein
MASPLTEQLHIAAARSAHAHEEVRGQEDSVEGNTDAFADGQVECAETETTAAAVAEYRRQLKEPRCCALDFALELELAKYHGVDVVRDIRVRVAAALLHARGDVLQGRKSALYRVRVGAEIGV